VDNFVESVAVFFPRFAPAWCKSAALARETSSNLLRVNCLRETTLDRLDARWKHLKREHILGLSTIGKRPTDETPSGWLTKLRLFTGVLADLQDG
jgi:hypothetical protein